MNQKVSFISALAMPFSRSPQTSKEVELFKPFKLFLVYDRAVRPFHPFTPLPLHPFIPSLLHLFTYLFTFVVLQLCYFGLAHSLTILEASVATVEDEVITLSEFNERYEAMKRSFPDISKKEVLQTLINRLLLLREARLSRIAESRGLSPAEEDRIIEEYIEIKIRSSIRISEEEIQDYYKLHRPMFEGRSFQEVAEAIERILIEKKTNDLLKEHLQALRKKAYIFINKEFQD